MRGIARLNHMCWVGVVIAITLLGHDVLMAADAHGQNSAGADAAHSTHHHAGAPDIHHGLEEARDQRAQAPTDDRGFEACSGTRQLVQRPDDSLQLDAAPMAVLAALPALALRFTTPDWWREPIAPPDIVRALFQVFLI